MKYIFIAAVLLVATTTPTAASQNDFVKPIQKNITQNITYAELREEAIFNCPWAKQINKDKEEVVSTLIEIEKQYNLPPELKGMLVAAACHESGYETEAKGDYRKKKPKALGLFQMWPWWEKTYKVDRKNPEASAIAYMEHIKKMHEKVSRQCKIKSPVKKWLAAWATAIRAPKKGGRCNERPLFYRVLKKWHSNINQNSALQNGKSGC